MTIYIENFLIQNILINFCLLRLIYLTTKSKTTAFKLILSSILGASFSVVSAIMLDNYIVMNILKFSCAFLMLLIAFKQTKKQFVFNYILLFIFTFALSGAVNTFSSATYYTNFGTVTTSKFSIEVIALIVALFTYVFELVTKHLKAKIKTNDLIYPITLYHLDKQISLNAFLDTGNMLTHADNPVIIVDLDSYLKLTNKNLMNFYLEQSDEVATGTVNGNNKLKIYKIDKVQINKGKLNLEIKNQYIAVSTNKFSDDNYHALLSPLLF